MSDRKSNRWVVWLALMPAWLTPAIVGISRDHGAAVRAMLPMLANLMLVVAGAALVAAVLAGVHAWRGARRHA